VRERISLADSFFPEETYVDAGNELRETVAKAGILPGEEGPTYFELMTLYFFLCARQYHCDTLVIETGIGGRLDASNIVSPDLSIIMPIELEHCDLLGTTIRAIAGEKAGIIKEGKPLLLSNGHLEESLDVFKHRCLETGSPLLFTDDFAQLVSCTCTTKGCNIDISIPNSEEHLTLTSPMPARIQASNAACAAAAAIILLGRSNRTYEAIKDGIARARLPARFQIVQEASGPVVVDGSHTPRSMSMVVETWRELYGKSGILLFSCAEDKDLDKIAEVLVPLFERVIVTRIPDGKTSDIVKIGEAFKSRGAQVLQKASFLEALEYARKELSEYRDAAQHVQEYAGILVTGSFYLASAVLRSIGSQPL
jgi:dihydrofolate synthase/folylpolyglutamate synthase